MDPIETLSKRYCSDDDIDSLTSTRQLFFLGGFPAVPCSNLALPMIGILD